jgi:(1->4)-alpha-D-glucan 1-alpha-D-glucosylmutase
VSIPRATMRLQFHHGFPFEAAIATVPYLATLGVSHLYASPIMTARPGSMHGYDVVDPTTINPELGGEAAFRQLVAALRAAELSVILDIVPNHMAVGNGNPWWLDVLQHGRQSDYARYFDIEWEPEDPTLHGKVLVPFLGTPYAQALGNGDLNLHFNAALGRYEARYFDQLFPIAPDHAEEIERLSLQAFSPATPAGRAKLHDLLERQNFRLAWWRSANDTINWRRFFDINELVALRAEDEVVFEATHALVFRLYAQGLIDGVRIDHIDGLADPKAYCRRLRARLDSLTAQRPAGSPAGPAYIVVEKILGTGEQLPSDWACHGTSGYDFMDQVSRVLHDPDGAGPLSRMWSSLSGRPDDFAEEDEASRYETLDRSFSAQFEAATAALYNLAQSTLEKRDTSRAAIRRSLTEILAHMGVYRTYVKIGAATKADTFWLGDAAEAALQTCLRSDRDVVRSLVAWLGGVAETAGNLERQSEAIRKFQQLSSPLAAKAVEDTAFYRHGVLLSRIEVGSDPSQFADSIAKFHHHSTERARRFAHAMLATATHDHKRGEDMRARLAVLSEIADEWSETLSGWLRASASSFDIVDDISVPSLGDAMILFQTLVGAWPMDLSSDDREGCQAFAERVAAWQEKAMREAKLATDWTEPDEAYETAGRNFLMQLFDRELIAEIESFANRIAPAGALNGLTQTLLKLTVPGVPDIYQGCEFWDLSLVDPDNRRPVDFVARVRSLDEGLPAVNLAATWRDGRVKQALIHGALTARQRQAKLFAYGDYVPLEVEGAGADHVVAFLRRRGEASALIVASRLVARWLEGDTIVVPPSRWGETRLRLPSELSAIPFRDVLASRTMSFTNGHAPISQILEYLPVALLVFGKE